MVMPHPTIRFLSNNIPFSLSNRKKLRRFILSIFQSERKKVEALVYVFSDDDFIRSLNKKFLNHNYATDILTFPITQNHLIKAEVYISIERVKENSILYKSSFKEELLRVMF